MEQRFGQGHEFEQQHNQPDNERERIVFNPEELSDEERLAEASQEISAGLPSPFPRIPEDAKNLTPQQEAILWANRRLEQFRTFIPGTSNRKTRFLSENSAQLLQRAQYLDVIAETWSKESLLADRSDKKTQSFLEELMPFLRSESQKRWRDMTHEQLADVIRNLTYSDEAQPLATTILQGYFEGPIRASVRGSRDVANAERRSNVISAYSRFAEAGLDLVEHPEALEKVVLIGHFRDDEILSRNSDFYRHYMVSTHIAFDDKVFQDTLVADRVLGGLVSLTSVSLEDDIQLQDSFIFNDERLALMRRNETERLVAKFGSETVIEKIKILEKVNEEDADVHIFATREELEAYRSEWPVNLLYDRSHPLNNRFEEEVNPKVIAYQTKRRRVDPFYEERGLGKSVIISLAREDGSAIDMYVPDSLMNKRVEIVNQFLHTITYDPPRWPREDFRGRIVVGTQQFEGTDIQFSLRNQSESEKRQHPVTRLEPIGFPTPEVEDGKSVREVNQDTAQRILRGQIRYPTSRRIRVPLEHVILEKLGYRNVTFSRVRDTNNLRADIDFIGQIYSILLDDNLDFDLEGRAFRNQDFRESVRYTLLSILDPILTTERNYEDVDEGETTRRRISRIGHMRRLQEGKTYSEKAIINFLQYEQGDLVIKNSELQAEKQTERNFTYVRPIISDVDEELQPVTYRVPAESFHYI